MKWHQISSAAPPRGKNGGGFAPLNKAGLLDWRVPSFMVCSVVSGFLLSTPPTNMAVSNFQYGERNLWQRNITEGLSKLDLEI